MALNDGGKKERVKNNQRDRIFQEEDFTFPGRTYREVVLEPAYNEAPAGADYISEVMTATQITANSLGRFVQDLLLWSTQEYGVLKVKDNGKHLIQIIVKSSFASRRTRNE
ncbi:hypothetical protein V7075_10660 [Neobacillus drentensis]|uniref:hypothetical protein n=1 Tax=Neobacillus drentensis TaxID=220684 RepID=UPI003000A39B